MDPDRYPCVSPHVDRSPIVTFTTGLSMDHLGERLAAERIAVALSPGRIRVSPAIFMKANLQPDSAMLAGVEYCWRMRWVWVKRWKRAWC